MTTVHFCSKFKFKFHFTTFLLLLIITGLTGQTQDTLKAEHLKPFTFEFEINDFTFSQQGLDFFEKESEQNQYIVIGEYHGSARISEFTQTLIPVFDQAGCKHFALEVGPESAQLLQEMSSDASMTVEKLQTFNTKYHIVDEDDYPYTAIPFFEHEEDATFLAEASRKQWNLIGIDQEFIFGYVPLLERLFDNLSKTDQAKLQSLKNNCIDSLEVYYQRDMEGTGRVSQLILNNEAIESFLRLSAVHEENRAIVEAIRKTTAIYSEGANRRYLNQNAMRIRHMKDNLRNGMERAGFDLGSDKLLLKTGAFHAGRGWSPLGLYELGNTLNELAEFHGNNCLNIKFQPRYYKEDGEVKDDWNAKNGLAELVVLGKKDKWTVVDLRPLKESVFYFRKYFVNDYFKNMMKTFDIIIIPPVDFDPKVNIKGS